ncbi:MAG TPA: AAA family ATPase [Acidimicrobiales bacterium]
MLVGRSGLSPVMVGRAAELDRLAGLLGPRRDAAVALVAGEAGIGKTRLVQELVRRAPAGTVVLAGQADPGTEGRPFELLLDAVDAHLARALAGDARPPTDSGGAGGAADRERRDRLAAVAAILRDPDRAADERVPAAVELVRLLGHGAVTVLVFEDLHWADAESVTVWERLAEPWPGRDGAAAPAGLVLVGTYRPDALSRRHPAAEALPRLERRHTVTHIHLARLSPAEVSSFLAAVCHEEPSFRTVDALHTRTGGNPFFLEELVAAAGHMPGLDADAPLPWTVAELVRAELDGLDPAVRDVVTAAAVLGRRVSFDLLAAVTGAPEDDLIARLHVAVDRGVLEEREADVFSFRHELAREAVEGTLLGRERRRLHEAALQALRASGSRNHVALAHHARGAGRFDELVVEARLGAHESLALGSSYQALQLAEAGLDEVPGDLDLLGVAARAGWLAGALDDAVSHADRWIDAARRAGDLAAEAEALAVRARVAYERGDIDGMAARTDALIALVDRLPGDEDRARAMAAVAQSYMLREQADATLGWSDKALALAEAGGFDQVRLAAMVEKGSMLMLDPAREGEARDLLEAAVDEAERIGEHLIAARALNNLVWHARRWTDADGVGALVERMRAHADAAGFEALGVDDAGAWLAQLALLEGDLDAAIAHLDATQRSARRSPRTPKAPWIAIFRAGLALEAGDLDTARRLTESLRPPTARTRVAMIGLDLHLALRHREVAAARGLLTDLLQAIDGEGSAAPSQVHDLVSAGLAAGLSPDELRPLADRMGHFAGHRLAANSPWRRLVDAQLAEAADDVEGALAGYLDAAAALRQAPDTTAGHQGTAHAGAAAALILAGRPDEARAHATHARRHLERWRGWRVERLEAVERRLGIGAEPAGPEVLTPREREVVALLAEGLTNAQLAERLFISPRTAAVHVSNILTKLDMSSRAEVAAWGVRAGLAGR